MTNGIIIGLLGILLLITAIVFLIKRDLKTKADAEILFFEQLRPKCIQAQTVEDCDNAYKIIYERCVDNGFFIIPSAYRKDFYELKAYLEGKREILIKTEQFKKHGK